MSNCPECKNTLPEKANFCPHCGKILSLERTLPLEELPLTFLRADLSGFTGLSESMTAEDVMNFLNNLFGSFYEIIEKYKGILYQVIGDEIVGIFGLSRESGYAPHLSIMAIEEIINKVKECNKTFQFIKECKIKCGLEMAPASIYNIKGDLHDAIIVTEGFAKSLVLQKNAENNVVLVGESLYQATRSFFEYEEFGINICRIYPKGHPSLESVIQRIKILLKELPIEQESVSIVVIEDVLMMGDDRFESKKLPLVKSLVDRFTRLGVKSITFDINAPEDEIRAFFLAMAATPADLADYGDIVALIRARGILSIKINKYRVGVVSSDEEIKQLDWTNFLESLVISQETWTDEDRIKQLGSFLAGIGVLGNESAEVQTQKVIGGLEKLAGMIADQYGEERWDEYAVIFSRMLAVLSPTIKKNIARYKTENKKLALLFKSLIPTMADEDIIDIIATKAKEKGPNVEDEIVDILKNITDTRLPDILSSIRVNVPEINFEKIVARLMGEMKATKGTDVADKLMEKNLEQQMRSIFPQLRDPSPQKRAEAIDKLMQMSGKIYDTKNYELVRLLVDRFNTLSDTEEELDIFKKIMNSLRELYILAQKNQREEIVQFISKKFSRHLVRKEKSLLDKKHMVIRTIAEIKDQNYLPELVSLLWDQGSYVEARDALIAMADYAIPMLIETLKDAEDKSVRMKIIDVLIHIGEKVVPEAIKLLESSEWYIKRNGIYILGELKVRSTIEHLGRLLEDKDERMQLAAIESLNKIGGEGVYEYIKLGLKSTHRSVVILTMKSLPREDVKDKLLEVATWLKQRKSIPDEKEEQFRRSIIEVLGEKGDDTILEYLTAILEEKPFFKGELIQATKLSVLNAIAKIGTPKAIEILNNIANQKDPVLASTGRELLRKKRDALIT